MKDFNDVPTFEELENARIWRKRFAIFLILLAVVTVCSSLMQV